MLRVGLNRADVKKPGVRSPRLQAWPFLGQQPASPGWGGSQRMRPLRPISEYAAHRESINGPVTAMPSILKNLWTRLTAGSGESGSIEPSAEAVEYKGYRIRPAPYPAKGQFQTAGVIEKSFESGVKEHRFIRAETHASKDEATAFSISKAKQIIDEQGDRIFT